MLPVNTMRKGESEGAGIPMLQAGRACLPALIALLLVLAIALRLGAGGRALLEPEAADVQQALSPASLLEAGPDIAALQALDLFSGNAPSSVATGSALLPPPASETALNVRLEGVMLAGSEEQSVAIIVSNERQGSYRVGELLPVGQDVRLASIHADHVVISNRGEREALWLYAGRESGRGTPAAPQGAGGSQRRVGTASIGGAVANLTSANPAVSRAAAASLAEIISVSPAVENGRLVGYRLTPGAKLKEFVQLGFRTNDVVTSVNGIALDDTANLPQLYGLMNGATEVSFSLLREGEPMTLQVSLASR